MIIVKIRIKTQILSTKIVEGNRRSRVLRHLLFHSELASADP